MKETKIARKFFGALVVTGLVLLAMGEGRAQVNAGSANWLMPGCQAALQNPIPPGEIFRAGICMGNASIMLDMAVLLGFCAPSGAIVSQAIRITVQYIEARPARMHERFSHLALEALRSAWPCR